MEHVFDRTARAQTLGSRTGRRPEYLCFFVVLFQLGISSGGPNHRATS